MTIGSPAAPTTVLVAGAINTDLVARVAAAPAAGETVTGHGFAIYGGGKGANQAVAASRSGAAVAIVGAVGNDEFGRQRLADLIADRIDVAAVATVDAASGVALIVVEETTGQNRIAYVPGATLAVTPEQATDAVVRAHPTVVLATLEPPPPTLHALFSAARAGAATVILNATPDPETGRALLPLVDILIVNESEASALLARPVTPTDAADAALELTTLGAPTVVVTLGAAGAVIAADRVVTPIAAPAVAVVDTTGAGDAFCGAVASALAAGHGAITAARSGVAAGSLAATKAGAQPSMPNQSAIAALLSTMNEGAV